MPSSVARLCTPWRISSTGGSTGVTGLPARGRERLLHGKGQDGNFLAHAWDWLNAETALLYVLAVGADPGVALGPGCWAALDPCYGCAAGLRFASADLGLFVFQYSMELLDLQHRDMGGPLICMRKPASPPVPTTRLAEPRPPIQDL